MLVVCLCIALAPACVAKPAPIAMGQDYWHIRPAVPLSQALGAAGRALGKDAAQFYCVSATIIPSLRLKPGGGTMPITPDQIWWYLTYAAVSGQQKTVRVSPEGHATVNVPDEKDDAHSTGRLVNVSPIVNKKVPPARRRDPRHHRLPRRVRHDHE
jgi:hypothetical protein